MGVSERQVSRHVLEAVAVCKGMRGGGSVSQYHMPLSV